MHLQVRDVGGDLGRDEAGLAPDRCRGRQADGLAAPLPGHVGDEEAHAGDHVGIGEGLIIHCRATLPPSDIALASEAEIMMSA